MMLIDALNEALADHAERHPECDCEWPLVISQRFALPTHADRSPTTPGPWEVVWSSNTGRPMEILGPDRRKIVRWGGLGEPASTESVGNAKLIAAAPEQQARIEALADALEGVVKAHETGAIALWRDEDFVALRPPLRAAGRLP